MTNTNFTNFVDQVVRAYQDPSTQEPLFIQLRAAMRSAQDGLNTDGHSNREKLVNDLLAQIPYGGRQVPFTDLMARGAGAHRPPAEITALTAQLTNSSMAAPGPSKEQAAAMGRGPPAGFRPLAGSPFYYPQVDFNMTTARIFNTFKAGLEEAQRLTSLSEQSTSNLRTYLQKCKKNQANPLRRMACDLRYIGEFLQNGRPGWALSGLPDRFFSDILPIAEQFMHMMQALAMQPYCQALKDIVYMAFHIRQHLKWLQCVRQRQVEKQRQHTEANNQAQRIDDVRRLLEIASLEPGIDEKMESLAVHTATETEGSDPEGDALEKELREAFAQDDEVAI